MAGERSTNGGEERGIQGLMGNRSFGIPTGTWEDDIKTDLQEIGR